MPKRKRVEPDEIANLLYASDDNLSDSGDSTDTEIDDIVFSDGNEDSNCTPDCDVEIQNQNRPLMQSNPEESDKSDNIIKFNVGIIYGKDKSPWKTTPDPVVGRTPARNVMHFKKGPLGNAKQARDVMKCFELFITQDMINIIVCSTNYEIKVKRSTYKLENYTTSETCFDEIKALFGILIKAAALQDNHLTTGEMWDIKNGGIWYRAVMSRDRFNFLLNCLRFDDKTTRLERRKSDRFAPIREIWDLFIHNCKTNYSLSQYSTLDEQLLAFRGRCPFKMYIPNKPAKYGIKIVMLCDNETKYMINAEPYLGEGTNTSSMPLSEYYIENMTRPIHGSNRNVTMDNWFTTIPAAKKLLKAPYSLSIVGTLKKNKREIPTEMLNVQKCNIGKTKFCFDENLTLLSY